MPNELQGIVLHRNIDDETLMCRVCVCVCHWVQWMHCAFTITLRKRQRASFLINLQSIFVMCVKLPAFEMPSHCIPRGCSIYCEHTYISLHWNRKTERQRGIDAHTYTLHTMCYVCNLNVSCAEWHKLRTCESSIDMKFHMLHTITIFDPFKIWVCFWAGMYNMCQGFFTITLVGLCAEFAK